MECVVKVKVHVSPGQQEDADTKLCLKKCLNNSSELCYPLAHSETTFDEILHWCAKECQISPVYLYLFALRDSETGNWINLSSTCEDYTMQNYDAENVKVELRVRYCFKSEEDLNGQMCYSHRLSLQVGDITKPVMNEIVTKYLFYQRRRDFVEGKFLLEPSSTKDETSALLGVAVLDMLRLAGELGISLPRVQRKVSFKKLLPHFTSKKINSMSLFNRARVHMQFRHYINHFAATFERYLKSNCNITYMYTRYLLNLELVAGAGNREVYTMYGSNNNQKIIVSGDCGIVKHSEKDKTEEKCCDFIDITDMNLSHTIDGGESFSMVSISLLRGGMIDIRLATPAEAYNLATCIDGYYRLLVDPHHYLCTAVAPPSLVKQLKLSCHGPISCTFAEEILKLQTPLHVGDCLLRQSQESYDDYYINTVAQTEPSLELRNYKLDRVNGLLGVYGDDNNTHEYEDLELLLESCRNGTHDPLPFQIDHMMPPQVGEKSNLLVQRCGQVSHEITPDDDQVAIAQLFHRDYTFVGHLGSGKFSEVKLYRNSAQPQHQVVIKNTVSGGQKDFGQKQSVEYSFESSWKMLSKVNTSHVVQLLGMMNNKTVLQFVRMGSILKYLQELKQPATQEDGLKAEMSQQPKDWDNWYLLVLWQLAHACTYLEERNLAHGNIRGKNVLLWQALPQPHIKLSDPGVLASLAMRSNVYEPVLPAPWLAYEFCRVTNAPHVTTTMLSYPSVKADKWSYATTVCEICNWGKEVVEPCSAYQFTADMSRRYTSGNVLAIPSLFSGPKYDELSDLLQRCWNWYPLKRPDFRQILRELRAVISDANVVVEPDETELSSYSRSPSTVELDTYDDVNLLWKKRLGEGHFGQVDLYEYLNVEKRGHEHQNHVAVKSFRGSMDANGHEIETMRSLDHQFIVKLRGITRPSERIVLEYVDGGSLVSWLSRQKEQLTGSFSRKELKSLHPHFLKFSNQIARGMIYLQDWKILHRDLALRNILLAKDPTGSFHVKISDFGLSRILSDHCNYYVGNPDQFPLLWYAPECLGYNRKVYKFESDIWSYGVTVWEMFSYCARPTYPDVPNFDISCLPAFQEKLRNGMRLAKPPECPDEVYGILQQCWRYVPEDRIRFPDLRDRFDELHRRATALSL